MFGPLFGRFLSSRAHHFKALYSREETFMNRLPESDSTSEIEATPCVARSVLEVLAENPALEAVTFKPDRQTISVATIGKADVPQLTERIRAKVQRAQEAQSCTL